MRCILTTRWKPLWVMALAALATGLALTPGQIKSAVLTEQEVEVSVDTWVRYVTADARPDAQIEQLIPHFTDGRITAYVATLEDGGFCVSGADDRLLTGYLYSPHAAFDSTNPVLDFVFGQVDRSIRYLDSCERTGIPLTSTQLNELANRQESWNSLKAQTTPPRNALPAAGEPDSLVLSVTCKWDQGAPYNLLCPPLPPGSTNYTLVGCGATAMAQIMYYWQWPIHGNGIDSTYYPWAVTGNWIEEPCSVEPAGLNTDPGFAGRLEWTATGGGRLRMNGVWDYSIWWGALNRDSDNSVYLRACSTLFYRLNHDTLTLVTDFGASAYEWSRIRNVHYYYGDPADNLAVSKLCADAAVAIRMLHGAWVSYSLMGELAVAMEDHLRYDSDAEYIDGIDPTDIIHEIQFMRPINLNGPGHFFVCHGYNSALAPPQFLMNYGKSSAFDDWYRLDNIVPLGGQPALSYTRRIAPESAVKFCLPSGSATGDGSPSNPYLDFARAVSQSPEGATLIFRAGSSVPLSSTVLISKNLTLKGCGVTIGQ